MSKDTHILCFLKFLLCYALIPNTKLFYAHLVPIPVMRTIISILQAYYMTIRQGTCSLRLSTQDRQATTTLYYTARQIYSVNHLHGYLTVNNPIMPAFCWHNRTTLCPRQCQQTVLVPNDEAHFASSKYIHSISSMLLVRQFIVGSGCHRTVFCWKWLSLNCVSVQISFHGPVHESSQVQSPGFTLICSKHIQISQSQLNNTLNFKSKQK